MCCCLFSERVACRVYVCRNVTLRRQRGGVSCDKRRLSSVYVVISVNSGFVRRLDRYPDFVFIKRMSLINYCLRTLFAILHYLVLNSYSMEFFFLFHVTCHPVRYVY